LHFKQCRIEQKGQTSKIYTLYEELILWRSRQKKLNILTEQPCFQHLLAILSYY